ncbi:MAG: FTR1 family protein, partial [Acidobacteria bacterium]|nr:FTR1 family protein [Acidobacteriota bacterium]
EAFLIVAITLAYLKKTGRSMLARAVYWGVFAALIASAVLGWVLRQGVNQALWEAVLGLVTVVLVGTLVVHMWRTAHRLKRDIEDHLEGVSTRRTGVAAFTGVFLFTVIMIAREGMETALLLYQVRDQGILTGAFLGLATAAALAWAWGRYGHLINLKRFFQVTSIFLLLFMLQVGIYSFHEFAEAEVLPNSEALHAATEIFSPQGLYGRWFSLGIVAVCVLWLGIAAVMDRRKRALGYAR